MKHLASAAVVIAMTLAISITACNSGEKAAAPDKKTDITWSKYTEGRKAALETGKPVMVDFYTTWCKYCKKLDQETFKDAAIIKTLNEGFVAIKVNAEGKEKLTDNGKEMTEQDLAKGMKVSGYPTLFFFDEKGEVIGPLPGFQTPDELKPVLTFISSGSYAKGIKYSDYLESLK